MTNSSQELKLVSKAETHTPERMAAEEAFSGVPPLVQGITEEIKKYLEAECQKEVKKFLEQSNKEHAMNMRERQAGVNTSNAITGVIVAWGIIGITMLARSCINFDKGPKFKV